MVATATTATAFYILFRFVLTALRQRSIVRLVAMPLSVPTDVGDGRDDTMLGTVRTTISIDSSDDRMQLKAAAKKKTTNTPPSSEATTRRRDENEQIERRIA